MQNGWIKLHRKLLEWEWYDKSEMVHLFIHLILSANHEEKKWRGVSIKRGQLVTGLDSLNKQTGISIRKLRTGLERLEKSGEIDRQRDNQKSIITIINYEHYNNKDEVLTSNPTSDRQAEEDKFSSEVETIYEFALSYFPENLHPNTNRKKYNWKDTIDKLMRIDGRDKKDICRVIKWARQNEFWSKNFLSLTKLRQNNKEEVKYYDVFKNQMEGSKDPIKKENPNLKKL